MEEDKKNVDPEKEVEKEQAKKQMDEDVKTCNEHIATIKTFMNKRTNELQVENQIPAN